MKTNFLISVILASFITTASAGVEIVSGKKVNPKDYPTIGKLNGSCTATLIGPKAILTAGHCISPFTSDFKQHFQIGGEDYIVQFDYMEKFEPDIEWGRVNINNIPASVEDTNGDFTIGILDRVVKGIKPKKVSFAPVLIGEELSQLGYGDTGLKADNYGTLREGKNIVDQIITSGFIFKSNKKFSTLTCFGDSGGPSLNINGDVVGIHAQSTCVDASYDIRLDTPEMKRLFGYVAKDHPGIILCGFNDDCAK